MRLIKWQICWLVEGWRPEKNINREQLDLAGAYRRQLKIQSQLYVWTIRLSLVAPIFGHDYRQRKVRYDQNILLLSCCCSNFKSWSQKIFKIKRNYLKYKKIKLEHDWSNLPHKNFIVMIWTTSLKCDDAASGIIRWNGGWFYDLLKLQLTGWRNFEIHSPQLRTRHVRIVLSLCLRSCLSCSLRDDSLSQFGRFFGNLLNSP